MHLNIAAPFETWIPYAVYILKAKKLVRLGWVQEVCDGKGDGCRPFTVRKELGTGRTFTTYWKHKELIIKKMA